MSRGFAGVPVWMVLACLFLFSCEKETSKPVLPVCGDGRIEDPEECEPDRPTDRNCGDFGFSRGVLLCSEDCRFDLSGCTNPPDCATLSDACLLAGETRCREGERAICGHDDDGCLVFGDPQPCESGTCESGADCRPLPTGGPVWFLHVSDLHYGKNPVAPLFEHFLDVIVPAISPTAIFNTGDMVDLGEDTAFWEAYAASLAGRVPEPPQYLEIVGNHDVKGDDTSNFFTWTPTGQWDSSLYGPVTIETPAGDIGVIRTNTASGNYNWQNVNGYFANAQASDLLAFSPLTDTIARILLAHHPTVGLIPLSVGRDRMRDVMAHFGVHFYLCGHLHRDNITWDEEVLLVQASEFAVDGTFMLLAKDGDVVSAAPQPLTGPWVLVTTPADRNLGGTNPHAQALAPGEAFSLRALGFTLGHNLDLEVRLGTCETLPMTPVRPGVWEIDLISPPSPGVHAVTVRATSSEGIAEHVIEIEVR